MKKWLMFLLPPLFLLAAFLLPQLLLHRDQATALDQTWSAEAAPVLADPDSAADRLRLLQKEGYVQTVSDVEEEVIAEAVLEELQTLIALGALPDFLASIQGTPPLQELSLNFYIDPDSAQALPAYGVVFPADIPLWILMDRESGKILELYYVVEDPESKVWPISSEETLAAWASYYNLTLSAPYLPKGEDTVTTDSTQVLLSCTLTDAGGDQVTWGLRSDELRTVMIWGPMTQEPGDLEAEYSEALIE